jgi:hypothetical protein
MRKLLYTLAVSLLFLENAVAEEKLEYATEQDLLVTNRVTPVKKLQTNAPNRPTADLEYFNKGYRLAFRSEIVICGKHKKVTVRIWDKTMKSWPGSQPQVIQIVHKDNVVLSAKKVGGEPMMMQAWTSQYRGRLFVYVKCRHRRGPPPGTYIYEVAKDNSIEEKGIFFDKKDLEAREKRVKEMLDKFRKKDGTPPLPTRACNRPLRSEAADA